MRILCIGASKFDDIKYYTPFTKSITSVMSLKTMFEDWEAKDVVNLAGIMICQGD